MPAARGQESVDGGDHDRTGYPADGQDAGSRDGKPLTAGSGHLDKIKFEERGANVLDAAAKGTIDGLHLALNVAAMLIIPRAGSADGWNPERHDLSGGTRYSLVSVQPGKNLRGDLRSGGVMIGVPGPSVAIGNLLGTRMVLNELVAFTMLGAPEGITRSALGYDCHVRAVRIRQLRGFRASRSAVSAPWLPDGDAAWPNSDSAP